MDELHVKTITEMKRLNTESGDYWFSEETMRAFGTRIESEPDRNMFVTSEKPPGCRRNYSIRKFNIETCHITTIGTFGGYVNFGTALKAMRELKDVN